MSKDGKIKPARFARGPHGGAKGILRAGPFSEAVKLFCLHRLPGSPDESSPVFKSLLPVACRCPVPEAKAFTGAWPLVPKMKKSARLCKHRAARVLVQRGKGSVCQHAFRILSH